MFTRRTAKTIAGTTLGAAALGMAALIAAGPAAAGSVDSQFINAIDQAGISVENPQQVIKVAKNVCSALDQGTSANEILSQITSETDLSTKQAKTFIVDSVQAYCPEYLQDS